jgi:hypothetical protein
MVGRLYRGLRRPQLEELSRAFDGDTRLDHLTTLELGRLVLRGLPSDTAAVSVYLGFTAFNEVTTPGDARARVLLLSDSELTRPSAGELPADIPKSFGKSLALRRQGPFMGMIRTPLEVPTAAFDQALEQPSGQTLQDLTRLRSLLTQSSYIGGGPLFLKAPMHDDGDFVMQLHEALFDESADFGGDGVLYVFSDTAFTQRP